MVKSTPLCLYSVYATVTEYDAQTHTNNHVCGHLLDCLLFIGASIHGNDDPTDDNSSADAADPLSASAPSFTPTATSPYAATGNTQRHTWAPRKSPHTQLKTIFVNVWAAQT